MNKKIKKTVKYLILALLAISAGFAGYWYFFKPSPVVRPGMENEPDKIYKVKRGDLIIGVLLTGSVNSKTKYKLSLTAPVAVKLVAVADENTKVTKGDVVARFETEELQNKIDALKLEVSNYEKDLAIAMEERAILLSANEADIRTAEDAVTMANDAFSKYWKLEGPRDKDAQTVKVDTAYKDYVDGKDLYETAKENYEKTVFKDDNEEATYKEKAENARKKMESLKTSYNSSVLDRKIFKRYTYPTKIKELKNKYEQAKLDLNKVKVKTSSTLAQKDNTIYTLENKKRDKERELENNLSYIPMMQLVAPTDGIVTYSDPDRRWGNLEVKVGMDVRRGEVLITLPDLSNLVVDVNIPEQYRSRVKIGNDVVITPDSIPNMKMTGKIKSIAALPTLLIPWDSGSPKIYRSVIELNERDRDPRVVSGMSVQVESVTQILKNVITVPIEAVFEERGKFFVYVKTMSKPEQVFVELGMANDNQVEIKSGLKEGMEVFLYRPYQSSKKN